MLSRRGRQDYYIAGLVTTQSPSLRPPPPLQPGHRPLEIRWIYDIPASSWRMLALLSMALFLAAYPELNRNHRNADPRKLEMPL